MTTRELDEVGAKPVEGNPRRPLVPKQPIPVADYGGASNLREFGQRARQGGGVSGLGSKLRDGSVGSALIAVGVHERPSSCGVGPNNPRLSVELQPRVTRRQQHGRLVSQLIDETPADLRDIRA